MISYFRAGGMNFCGEILDAYTDFFFKFDQRFPCLSLNFKIHDTLTDRCLLNIGNHTIELNQLLPWSVLCTLLFLILARRYNILSSCCTSISFVVICEPFYILSFVNMNK